MPTFVEKKKFVMGIQRWNFTSAYKQNFIFYAVEYTYAPIPVATRSKAWVYGRSLVGIAASNPAGGMDVFRMLSGKCLRRADPSSRRVLPSVCVTERDQVQQ